MIRRKFKDGWWTFFLACPVAHNGGWLIMRFHDGSSALNRCGEVFRNIGKLYVPVNIHITRKDLAHWLWCKRKHLKQHE